MKKQCWAIVALLSSGGVYAVDLTWDTSPGDSAAITAGSGAWNTTAGNSVWNDGITPNVAWSQTSIINPLHNAFFGGLNGDVDGYVVTLGAQMAASNLTFNSSGYKLTGSTLSLNRNDVNNGAITVAANTTNTIDSILRYKHNTAATITANAGSVLNLGGGTTAGNYNPQLLLTGDGTINITAGTYQTTIGNRNAAIINQTGGTWTMSDQSTGTNLTTSIGNAAGRNVSYTVSGTGTLNVLASNTGTPSYTLSLGRSMGAFLSTLTLKSGGTVNIGVTANRAGQINLGSFDANGTSLLDVQGGSLTVGTGKTSNKIIFFAAGADAGKTATLTQSGGTVIAQGIQFGANTGGAGIDGAGSNGTSLYDATALATLQLTGGALYVGSLGITRGSAAAGLPVAIQLSGGTVGATTANWSSALDMQLGTSGGGVTFQAADSVGTARNITLSGTLSDDGAVNGGFTKTGAGMLTLSGSNTYTGTTFINAGKLALGANNVLSDASSVSINSATLDAATFVDTVGTLDVTNSATLNLGTGAAVAFANNSAIDWTGGTLNITGTFIPGTSLRFGTDNTGLTATQLALITSAGFINFILDGNGYLTVVDITPPTVTSIVDNKSGGPVATNTLVTYTVTFNEPMAASTVTAADFDNAGTASVLIGAVTALTPAVFTVQVTPTSAGTLQLQIPLSASVTDAIGNPLDNDPALADDTILTVNSAPAATLAPMDIVDDQTGGPLATNQLVTYMVTFSQDMDASTVTAVDFGNAGTAAIMIGAVSETAPGVFTVEVTPTTMGTLQLQVNAYAVLRDATAGSVLDTTSAILDDTILAVSDIVIWDTVSGDGSVITPGSGNWNTTLGNIVWNNAGVNESWTQTSTNVPLKEAVFAGANGEADAYVITLASQIAASNLTFKSSGYKITGSTLSLSRNDVNNGTITVAPNTTNTINSVLYYIRNRAALITVGSNSVLNLGGDHLKEPQFTFTGAGTINIIAGTLRNTIGSLNNAFINLTGGAHTMSDAGTVATIINSTAGQDVNYTVSGGTLNVLGWDSGTTIYALALGSDTGNFKSILTLKTGGTVNIGTNANRAGQINIGSHNANVNALLDVQGGSLTIGTGKTTNKMIFFAAGANAGKTATLTQSGGTVTAQGIQFGANTGDTGSGLNGANAYDATALATLQLTGGALYVGTLGITRGSAAAALPVAIQLSGGTVGATTNWASALDMKLGTSNGGVTFQAADSGGTARNITLSGTLSDDGPAKAGLIKTGAGTLTLSGANTYSGTNSILAGRLALGTNNVLPDASVVSLGNGTLDAATYTDTAGPLGVTGEATLQLGAGAALAFADSTAMSWSSGTLNITGAFVPGESLRFGTNSKGLKTDQLSHITVEGIHGYELNPSGYLVPMRATIIRLM